MPGFFEPYGSDFPGGDWEENFFGHRQKDTNDNLTDMYERYNGLGKHQPPQPNNLYYYGDW